MRALREVEEHWGPFTVYAHPEWREAFPWLVQGVTGRSATPEARRLESRGGDLERALSRGARVAQLARVRQVHGADLVVVRGANPSGTGRRAADALATGEPGIGLAVSVADCVPAFLVDPVRGAVGVVHAGWRGAAAGVVEAALARMSAELGVRSADLHLHLGPAICGRCYEVGAEVLEALGRPTPGPKGHVDLSEVVEERAVALGVHPERVTRSVYCTRCDGERFYSYRAEGKRAGRMLGVIGLVRSPGR